MSYANGQGLTSTSAREKAQEARVLLAQAKSLASDPEATQEDKNKIPEMMLDVKKLREEAEALESIVVEGAQVDAMLAHKEEKDPDSPAERKSLDHASKAKWDGWNQFLWSVWAAKKDKSFKDSRLQWVSTKGKSGHQAKSLSGAVGSSGGFLIADQFMAELQSVRAEESIMRNAGATVIRMNSRSVSLPALDQTGTEKGTPSWFGGLKFYWEEEGGEKQESEPKFRKVTLVAKKLIGLTHASDELIDDAAISLADFLASPMGFAGGVQFMEDYSFLRGNGGGQPLGVLNSPSTLEVARETAGTVSYVDVINMLENFLPSASGTWVIHQSLMSNIIQLSGPTGNPAYVWHPDARQGIAGSLFGYPVRWTEKLPRVGTRGDILLMDARYYLIGDRQQTLIDTSNAPRWEFDESSWRVVHRIDGQPWLSSPITYIDGETQVSPFVVLAGTATT